MDHEGMDAPLYFLLYPSGIAKGIAFSTPERVERFLHLSWVAAPQQKV